MKRRDPWHEANGRPKAVADLVLSGQDAELNHRRVLTWFAGRWRNHQSKRAEKPHSKSSGGNALDGPATRPATPLAVENSVGKLTAFRKEARLMSAWERERGELPPPTFVPVGREAGGHVCFLDLQLGPAS